MGTKRLSVIIPVYNVEKYLTECLDSVINQSFKDIEIICINDGSTDGSLRILEEYAQQDDRIIIINQENQGQGVARNKGIDIASGKYIAFVDPDDYIDLDTFEFVNNKFKETNVDVVQFDLATCREDGKPSGKQALSKRAKRFLNYNLKNNQIFNWNYFNKKDFTGLRLGTPDKIYSANLIKKHNIRFAPTRHGEDNIFSIGVLLFAQKILYINKYFYHYRARQDSSVNKPSDGNYCVFDNVKLLKNFLDENNLYETNKQAYRDYIIKAFALHFSNIPQNSSDRYFERCKDILTDYEFKKFLQETKPKYTFWQRIFSIKNYKENGLKKKFICILGLTFEIKKHKKVD